MVAVLVESVGVEAVVSSGQGKARLATEHVVAQPLRSFDMAGIGGQQ